MAAMLESVSAQPAARLEPVVHALAEPEPVERSQAAAVPREEFERLQAELRFARTKIEALNLEVARLRQWRFGSSAESLQHQAPLFEALAADTEAEDRAADEARQPERSAPRPARKPVRQTLPESLPRIEHRHELTEPNCACGAPLERIGEDVSEQLDCVPAQFFVHRHIRGKYACRCCETVRAAELPARVIDKGLPAPGLLAQVVVAKYDDHLPLYRQQEIYARSGVHLARSTLAQWVGICGVRLEPLARALQAHILAQRVIHVDETPVRLLAPGKGKTHKAYVWVYRSTDFAAQPAVWFDFCQSRSGEHPRRVLAQYAGTLVTDDYAGYDRLHASAQITEAGCMAHARRKLFEVHQLNGSPIAARALSYIARLYEIEREARTLDPEARHQHRQQHARAVADELHRWLTEQRLRLAKADATARAIDYSLGRWRALTHYLDDGEVPIDNNAVENAIRPLALGRKNWLFVGSAQAGERAANLLSLIETAKLCGHDPWLYLRDVFERMPTTLNRDLHTLLPQHWTAPACAPAAPARPAAAP